MAPLLCGGRVGGRKGLVCAGAAVLAILTALLVIHVAYIQSLAHTIAGSKSQRSEEEVRLRVPNGEGPASSDFSPATTTATTRKARKSKKGKKPKPEADVADAAEEGTSMKPKRAAEAVEAEEEDTPSPEHQVDAAEEAAISSSPTCTVGP
jgi:hypothetical protein